VKSRITPNQAVFLAMLFFTICATIWAIRVPVVNGVPISFNSDEPSHFRVVKFVSEHWSLPPYTRDYYESAHPPLSDFIEAAYMKLWPVSLQIYALRLFSTVLGLLILAVVYRTAKLMVSPWTAAFVACFAATLPMFIMFSSSVTNDSLAVLISSSTVSLIVQGLKDGFTKKHLNLLCLLVGLAGIAKYSCLGLVPVAMGAVIFDWRRQGRSWVVPAVSVLASFTLISGWWYLRNQMLYGDIFRSKAEADMHMFTGNAMPHSLQYWGGVLTTMTGSTLGLYPSFPKWPLTIYGTVTALFGLVVAGAIVVALKRKWTPIKIALGTFSICVLAVVLVYQIDHYQAHGRLLYPAITVIALGIAGLRHLIDERSRPLVGVVSILAMACLSVAVVTSSF
jgi:4-amino-4-deoxy-L-arabinose transferase-like glycosyltransferase